MLALPQRHLLPGGNELGNRQPACAACPAHKNSSVGSESAGDCLCVPGYGSRAPSLFNLVWDFDALPLAGPGSEWEPPTAWIDYAASLGGQSWLMGVGCNQGVCGVFVNGGSWMDGYIEMPLPNEYTSATVEFQNSYYGQTAAFLSNRLVGTNDPPYTDQGVWLVQSGGYLVTHTFTYPPNSYLRIVEMNNGNIAKLKVTFPPIMSYARSTDPCTPCPDGQYSVGGHLDACSSCGWGAISEPPLAATNFDACLCNAAIGVYEA